MTRKIVDGGEMGDAMFWANNNVSVPITAVKFPCELSDGEWVYKGAFLGAYGGGDGHPAVYRSFGGNAAGLYVRYRLYIDNISQATNAAILGGWTVILDGDGNIVDEYYSWKFTLDEAFRFSFYARDETIPATPVWTKVATTNICLQDKTWYMIEFALLAGWTVTAKIDGNQVINTAVGFNIISAGLKFETNAYCVVYLDDIAADDTTWCGDTSFIRANPIGDGATSEWENSLNTGVNDYSFIDEYPYDNFLTYIKADMSCYAYACEQSNFTLQQLDYTNREIVGLWVEDRATSTGARKCCSCGYEVGILPSGGTMQWSEHFDWALSGWAPWTWLNCVTYYYATNPFTTLAWTEADVDALQFAVRVRESGDFDCAP